jgi:two-component system nitrogen regulation sensor histidine kinase GlnL
MRQPLLYESLISNFATSVVLLDKSLTIRFVNPAAESLFARSASQLNKLPFCLLWKEQWFDESLFNKIIKDQSGLSYKEVEALLADGRKTVLDVSVSFFPENDDGCLLLELRQVFNQKRLDQENHQHTQHSIAQELIRGLAHEIKNPLGGIRGAAQLLEKQLPQDELREFTQMIIEQSDRLRNLVDRLLGPNTPPRFDLHNVHRVLEKVMTILTAEHHDVEVIRDYDPSIPELWLDEDKIQQVLINIARNAVQAVKGTGDITFETRVDRQCMIQGERHPLVAKITVIDKGPGVPLDLMDTLFYPMVTGRDQGTGLGLSIAQNLVELHKGKIEVDSRAGLTKFCIYLPVLKKEVTG